VPPSGTVTLLGDTWITCMSSSATFAVTFTDVTPGELKVIGTVSFTPSASWTPVTLTS
jgi:hypothetical protein